MSKSSTERVRQFRGRQVAACRKRITLYLDHDTQRKLADLAGDQPLAAFLEKIVRTAIKRELNVIASCPQDSEPRAAAGPRNPLIYPGRRRSLAAM